MTDLTLTQKTELLAAAMGQDMGIIKGWALALPDQLAEPLNRIAEAVEQIQTTGAASASATAEIEAEKTDTHQLSLEERMAILQEKQASEVAEYEVANT